MTSARCNLVCKLVEYCAEAGPHTLRSVPPNVKFEIDDVESDWIFSSNFDFIHSRTLNGTIKDWPRLVRQAYKFVALTFVCVPLFIF
jgi:hypothetical protein